MSPLAGPAKSGNRFASVTLCQYLDGPFFMVIWKRIDEKAHWDALLAMFETKHYLQSWNWGEHRSNFGWEPFRCVASAEDGMPLTLVQFFLRRLPGKVGVVWVPGGPLGKSLVWADTFAAAVREIARVQHLVIKINALRPYGAEDALTLRSSGWCRTPKPLTSGLSMLWDISEPLEKRIANATKNWRHNLKRSQKFDLKVERWNEPNIDEVMNLYAEMQLIKGIPEQLSAKEVASIMKNMNEHLLLYRCLDADGKLIALRAGVLLGNHAWDLMAAASETARKTYASYLTLSGLIQDCHERGATDYDLAGIDPQGNKGVWDFKRGTGAESIEYLGEWECASSELLRKCVNLALRLKGGSI